MTITRSSFLLFGLVLLVIYLFVSALSKGDIDILEGGGHSYIVVVNGVPQKFCYPVPREQIDILRKARIKRDVFSYDQISSGIGSDADPYFKKGYKPIGELPSYDITRPEYVFNVKNFLVCDFIKAL